MFNPVSHLSSCTISQLKEGQDAQNFIGSHHFNHRYSVISPIIENQANRTNSGFYYYGKIPIRTFIDPDFINTYIKKFNFNALSVETQIDSYVFVL